MAEVISASINLAVDFSILLAISLEVTFFSLIVFRPDHRPSPIKIQFR